ncbi:hypothetical protein [Acidovorax sp. FJL06]|uniref:hypothetical protein n=1 Tax=Acidovorax sp. FJL06 TaxID=2153365 RepID=UPI000F5643CF|nr:hypothetical protein [Acidovorax sp. FJL06]RQO82065.1 hypothetical protein DBV10_10360 [Acidovorax sp. FJL06]
MNEFVAGVLRLLLRVVVIAMGLVLFASLVVAALVLALVWMLRAGWARLTGQPVTPWAMRMDPRTGFRTVFRSTERWSSGRRGAAPAADDTSDEATASRRGGILPGAAEVTDVEAREVR